LIRRAPLRRPVLAAQAPVPRSADTGPTRKIRDLVHVRSGGRCEWPDCPNARLHVHHRLNRKDGGRHGAARVRLNAAAWLVDACYEHHARVTSAVGDVLAQARAMGWVLTEDQDARTTPILLRHHVAPVLLDDAGRWEIAA
jgi:hypothetical protein